MLRKLLFPDPADGGDPPQPDPPAPISTVPAADAPPVSRVVVVGQKSERELALEREVEELRGSVSQRDTTIKDREMQLANLQDENHQLKKIPREPVKKKTEDWW